MLEKALLLLPYLDILAFCLGVSVIAAAVYRRVGRKGFGLFPFGLTLIVWGTSAFFVHMGLAKSERLFFEISSISLFILPTSLLITSSEYANSKLKMQSIAICILFVAAAQIFAEKLPSFLLENAYCLVFIGLTAYFFQKPFAKSDYQYRRRSNIIFAGILLVGFMFWNNIIVMNYTNPVYGLYLFTTAGVLICAMLIDLPFFELAYSREQVLESMPDGWMLLDRENRIVDFNPAASNYLKVANKEILGKRLDAVLREKHNIEVADFNSDINLQVGEKESRQVQYANLRIVALEGKAPSLSKIVFWRDITAFQKAELARQQARDEMTMLLHIISRAAIEFSSQKEFLRQAVLQITHSFHCNSGIFWMFETDENKRMEIIPTAWIGMTNEGVAEVSRDVNQPEIQDILIDLDKHHFIPDSRINTTLNLPLGKIEQCSLLIEPIFSSNQKIGMLWLMRDPDSEYSLEELTRLAIVVDEVATLNYFNQQNQAAVIAAERQRLMRDLHDSVTQRLYGLVALTEAAQAGIATGTGTIQPQTLLRIGEHARQAIKEMRLFLHQLQPINFEKETLVMLLHRRLAAVEGRSDVHTKFDADLEITFNPEKQKALYYIAQEALNNILRHASAKNVMLVLKKTPRGIIFTITDDGKGFDQRAWDTGGLGIKNMKARAKEIDARFFIKATPGKGTQVKVWIPVTSFLSMGGKKQDEKNSRNGC